MQIIGLTGGIASGKSSVAAMFKKANIPIIDADVLAKRVVEKGTLGLQQVIDHFGKEYLSKEGALKRQELAKLIFDDPKKREILEGILHPLIAEELVKEVETLKAQKYDFVIYEAPLIFETGTQKRFLATILVDVAEEIQLKRLMKRNGLSQEDAHKRLSSQMPRHQKQALADAILDNSENLDHTAFLLRAIWFRLTGQDFAFEAHHA